MSYEKDFANYMDQLGRHHDHAQVFQDFLTMAVCTFHRTNILSGFQEKDEDNEVLYEDVTTRYPKDELDIFSRLLGIIMLYIHEHPYSDLPGKYFMENISRGKNGQFFTPLHVCELMTLMHGEAGLITGQTVLDPACGSGRMLLTFAKHNPDNYFFGADNALSCARKSHG